MHSIFYIKRCRDACRYLAVVWQYPSKLGNKDDVIQLPFLRNRRRLPIGKLCEYVEYFLCVANSRTEETWWPIFIDGRATLRPFWFNAIIGNIATMWRNNYGWKELVEYVLRVVICMLVTRSPVEPRHSVLWSTKLAPSFFFSEALLPSVLLRKWNVLRVYVPVVKEI